MTILLTGAKGFIGKNLSSRLRNDETVRLLEYSHNAGISDLESMAGGCDCVVHLAGVNRPQRPEEYAAGNPGFTGALLETLEKRGNFCPIIFASSVQAELPNPYGLSKRMCEALLLKYGKKTGASILIYRLPNVFGKWCRPYHNSAVATFCHQIVRGQPVHVEDKSTVLTLAYIDDVVEELVRAVRGEETRRGAFCTVPVVYTKTLGEVYERLSDFRTCRETLAIPELEDGFGRKLYSTYQSYLPPEALDYPLKMNADDRGSFTEILRTPDRGQVSVAVTKPGAVRGGHWHQSKNEKFLVVGGVGRITLNTVDGTGTVSYDVSADSLKMLEIPPGYVHYIQNTGTADLVTVIWSNEAYDPGKPDTYFA